MITNALAPMLVADKRRESEAQARSTRQSDVARRRRLHHRPTLLHARHPGHMEPCQAA